MGAQRPLQASGEAPGYWGATVGELAADDGALSQNRACDVAIIGAGYTGLSVAWHLARSSNKRIIVLEANRPGWGCSGRNGSFARPAIGRSSPTALIERWGEDRARDIFAEATDALGSVKAVIRDAGIDCDLRHAGWLQVAHSARRVDGLAVEAQVLKSVFEHPVQILDSREIQNKHFRGAEAFGAIFEPTSCVLHPLKYAYGLLRAAREEGVHVHTASPVIDWNGEGGAHVLKIPDAEVCAAQVVVATNGYTTSGLDREISRGLLPVLSNIIVTRPMTAEELEATAFRSDAAISDTRTLLHYYRRLPDNRILFGGRGPISGEVKEMREHRCALLQALRKKFPGLAAIDDDFFWGGWVAVTRDFMPRVHAFDNDCVFYALGYSGSGVSAATYAGRRLAEHISGERPLSGILHAPLQGYPAASLRRLVQRLGLAFYRLRDLC